MMSLLGTDWVLPLLPLPDPLVPEFNRNSTMVVWRRTTWGLAILTPVILSSWPIGVPCYYYGAGLGVAQSTTFRVVIDTGSNWLIGTDRRKSTDSYELANFGFSFHYYCYYYVISNDGRTWNLSATMTLVYTWKKALGLLLARSKDIFILCWRSHLIRQRWVLERLTCYCYLLL